jgi:hypothetical protein
VHAVAQGDRRDDGHDANDQRHALCPPAAAALLGSEVGEVTQLLVELCDGGGREHFSDALIEFVGLQPPGGMVGPQGAHGLLAFSVGGAKHPILLVAFTRHGLSLSVVRSRRVRW